MTDGEHPKRLARIGWESDGDREAHTSGAALEVEALNRINVVVMSTRAFPIDGCDLHVEDVGSGPAVLMIHKDITPQLLSSISATVLKLASITSMQSLARSWLAWSMCKK